MAYHLKNQSQRACNNIPTTTMNDADNNYNDDVEPFTLTHEDDDSLYDDIADAISSLQSLVLQSDGVPEHNIVTALLTFLRYHLIQITLRIPQFEKLDCFSSKYVEYSIMRTTKEKLHAYDFSPQ